MQVVQTTDLGFSQSRDRTVQGQGSGRAQSLGFLFSWLRDGASSLCPKMAERGSTKPSGVSSHEGNNPATRSPPSGPYLKLITSQSGPSLHPTRVMTLVKRGPAPSGAWLGHYPPSPALSNPPLTGTQAGLVDGPLLSSTREATHQAQEGACVHPRCPGAR